MTPPQIVVFCNHITLVEGGGMVGGVDHMCNITGCKDDGQGV